MNKVNQSIWSKPLPTQLAKALVSIDSLDTMQKFLTDVMTEKEITEISARLEAARLLDQKTPYSKVAEATKLSSRTIARISEWMKNGTGGYSVILAHHIHIPPTHVE